MPSWRKLTGGVREWRFMITGLAAASNESGGEKVFLPDSSL
jgi:hypothetical protein